MWRNLHTLLLVTLLISQIALCEACARSEELDFSLKQFEDIIRITSNDQTTPLQDLLAGCLDEIAKHFEEPISTIIIPGLRLLVFYLFITQEEFVKILRYLHAEFGKDFFIETATIKITQFLLWRSYAQMLFIIGKIPLCEIFDHLHTTSIILNPLMDIKSFFICMQGSMKFLSSKKRHSSTLAIVIEEDADDTHVEKNLWPFEELTIPPPEGEDKVLSSATKADKHPNAAILRPLQRAALDKISIDLPNPLKRIWEFLIKSVPDDETLHKLIKIIGTSDHVFE